MEESPVKRRKTSNNSDTTDACSLKKEVDHEESAKVPVDSTKELETSSNFKGDECLEDNSKRLDNFKLKRKLDLKESSKTLKKSTTEIGNSSNIKGEEYSEDNSKRLDNFKSKSESDPVESFKTHDKSITEIGNCSNHESKKSSQDNFIPSDEDNCKNEGDHNESSSSTKELKDSSNPKDDNTEKSTEFASLVAAHYNSLENCKYEARSISRIYYLRNFNNWIKSMLIKECMLKIPEEDVSKGLTVLDMCCGKGGDLQKWRRSNIKHLICADIAETSLEQCETRYKEILSKSRRRSDVFECEFIHADCTRVRLRGKFKDPTVNVDVVSCQFSFHYCFESLPQAECMLRNASECLKPGGVFIGTIPDANEIVKRIRKSERNGFGNEVFSIEMCCEEPYPLFGAKYNFYLEGVVNCPEFLVHFPTFEKLGTKFGLKLIHRERFTEFFNKKVRSREGELLLKKMTALETYPPMRDMKLVGPEKEYIHSLVFYENNNRRPVGTLSKSEWEVISLYQTFIFVKGKTTWDAEGKPQYEF